MEATPISAKPPTAAAVAEVDSELRRSPAPGSFEEEPITSKSTHTPDRKRQPVEESGEGNGCKHCACKKSRCLKLYCPCFASGSYCSESCGCQPCFNKSAFEEIVRNSRKVVPLRNQRTSTSKTDRKSEAKVEAAEDVHSPASTQPKRGCHCKKSSCLKKYCECYQFGSGCSIFCQCEDCRNPSGKNEGTIAEDCNNYIFTGADLDHSEDADDLDAERSPPQQSPISKESSFQQAPFHATARASSRDRHLFLHPMPPWQTQSWNCLKRQSNDRIDNMEYRTSNDWLLSRHEENYTISRCIQILNGMMELSQLEKSLAPDVFLQPSNREIFVSLSVDVRTLWLRRKIQNLN